MLYTVNYLLFPHSLHGLRDQRLVAILREARQLSRTQLLELTLQLGKGELDRVPFGTVAHIVHPPEAELSHLCLALVRDVAAELIHEEADLVVAAVLAQPLEPLLELLDVHRLLEDPEVLLAFLFRDGRQQSQGRLIQLSIVDQDILLRQSPLQVRHRLPRKHRFVQVHDPESIVLGHRELAFHASEIMPPRLFCSVLIDFVPAVSLLLDPVPPVYFSIQGGIHVG